MPNRFRIISETGHSGLLTVVSRSCMKFSNIGLKSQSACLVLHLEKKTDKNFLAVSVDSSYVFII